MFKYVLALCVLTLSIPAPAQVTPKNICGPHDLLVGAIEEQGGHRSFVGLARNEKGETMLLEVFLGDEDEAPWGLVVTDKRMKSCLVAGGTDWQAVPREPTEREEPSL